MWKCGGWAMTSKPPLPPLLWHTVNKWVLRKRNKIACVFISKKAEGCYSVDGVKTMMGEIGNVVLQPFVLRPHDSQSHIHMYSWEQGATRKAEWNAREDTATCQLSSPGKPFIPQSLPSLTCIASGKHHYPVCTGFVRMRQSMWKHLV